jgi:N-methylhydantoinase B
VLLKAGDLVHIVAGGGGGFGEPADRSAALVRDDLESGMISAGEASREYGYSAVTGD